MKKVSLGVLLLGLILSPSVFSAPTDAEMMKKMQEAGAVTEMHKQLDYLAGTWNTSVKMWMDPKAPAQESQGKAEFSPIMGGRFMQEKMEADMKGQPFTGMGLTGYDNVKKKYVSTWIDSMSTGIYTTEGVSMKKGKIIESEGTFMCPVTNMPKTMRAVMEKISKNEVHYMQYMKDDQGKEFKSLEVTYRR